MRAPDLVIADKFRLSSLLGRGGMGELWVAEHLALHTDVVVKFMSVELASAPGAAERFAREAAAAARVNSPHVVKVLDYGISADGAPFIVMEKLDGRDLASLLGARGPLAPDMAGKIVRQVAKALTKAHSAGIVHRDVKPSNVFVCDAEGDLFVKLLDFGIAKTTLANQDDVTASGASVGTPGYMSPEQILGSKTIDLRSDLWSLGALAFHCLVGRKPFDGETAGAIALAIHTLPLPKPTSHVPSLPASVDAWFERACAREPEQRFASAIELSNALSEALALGADSLRVEDLAHDGAPEPEAAATRTLTGVGRPANEAPRGHRRSRVTLFVGAVALIAIGSVAYVSRTVQDPRAAPTVEAANGAPGSSVSAIEPSASPATSIAIPVDATSAAPAASASTSTTPRARPRAKPAPTASAPPASSTDDPSHLYVMPNVRR